MEPNLNSSDFKSSAYNSQINAWTMTADLWQSPLYIREQKTKYLEQFKAEANEKYGERLLRSVPRNKFRESIETMAGMVFKTDPAPEDVPSALSDLFTDIDACGNSLHSFLLTSFELFLRDGGGALWVDATPLSQTASEKTTRGEKLTAQDRIGDRPFWVFVEARQIINHRYTKIGGVDVLSQVTIEREEVEPKGDFGEEVVKRHYILRLGTFEVRKYDEKATTEDKWIIEVPETKTGLAEIPLVPLAPFGTAPPLLDLAMLTIQYYNKLSDFDDWCHNACVPQRVFNFQGESDVEKFSKNLKNSASTALTTWGPDAKVYWAEVSGNGLEIAKERIGDIAAEMAAIGVGMLAPSEVAPKSATEVLDTAGQRQSKLARYAREFENAVEKAFYFTSEYLKSMGRGVDLKLAEGTSLKLKMDFDRLTFSPEKMGIFKELVKDRNLSHQTFFEILEKMVDMPEGWTAEVEVERLAAEEAKLPKPIDLRTVKPQQLGAISEGG